MFKVILILKLLVLLDLDLTIWGFINDRSNFCCIDGPYNLFKELRNGVRQVDNIIFYNLFYHILRCTYIPKKVEKKFWGPIALQPLKTQFCKRLNYKQSILKKNLSDVCFDDIDVRGARLQIGSNTAPRYFCSSSFHGWANINIFHSYLNATFYSLYHPYQLYIWIYWVYCPRHI